MSDGLLESIIQLEARLQQQLTQERQRCAQWQEREQAMLQQQQEQQQRALEDNYQKSLTGHKAELLREGEELEQEAKEWCRRLSGLDDQVLKQVLMRRLSAILPGGEHDHPHGEG